MEATDRLINIIQDNSSYESFIIALHRFINGSGPKPALVGLNDNTMDDVMTNIIDDIDKLKKKG